MDRLTAWANTRNGRSQVALERAGYRREGVLRGLAPPRRHAARRGRVRHDPAAVGALAAGRRARRDSWHAAARPSSPPEPEKNSPDVRGVTTVRAGTSGAAARSRPGTWLGGLYRMFVTPRARIVYGCARSRHARRGRSGNRDAAVSGTVPPVAVDILVDAVQDAAEPVVALAAGGCRGASAQASSACAEEVALGATVPGQPQARRTRPWRAEHRPPDTARRGPPRPRHGAPRLFRPPACGRSRPHRTPEARRLARLGVGGDVAYGCGSTGTPRATLRNWMNSPGHREVVLSGKYRRAGLGVTDSAPCGHGAMWVLDVGRKYPRTASSRCSPRPTG